MVKVLIKKLDTKVELPNYKTRGSSGLDLMAFIESPINLSPKESVLVPTGISVAIPENLEIQIAERKRQCYGNVKKDSCPVIIWKCRNKLKQFRWSDVFGSGVPFREVKVPWGRGEKGLWK